MFGWSGVVKLFNGRHWRSYDVRVQATRGRSAAARAIADAIKQQARITKRSSIRGFQVTLLRLNGAEKGNGNA
jgi:hypothetical protein